MAVARASAFAAALRAEARAVHARVRLRWLPGSVRSAARDCVSALRALGERAPGAGSARRRCSRVRGSRAQAAPAGVASLWVSDASRAARPVERRWSLACAACALRGLACGVSPDADEEQSRESAAPQSRAATNMKTCAPSTPARHCGASHEFGRAGRARAPSPCLLVPWRCPDSSLFRKRSSA